MMLMAEISDTMVSSERKEETVPALLEDEMTRKGQTSMPVRLDMDAIEAAKIAASFKGETLTAYASRVLLEVANQDIDEFVKTRSKKAKREKSPETGGD
jgi:hypothetical protein